MNINKQHTKNNNVNSKASVQVEDQILSCGHVEERNRQKGYK